MSATQVKPWWRVVGILSGVGLGLTIAGLARLAGELIGQAVGWAPTPLALAILLVFLVPMGLLVSRFYRLRRPDGTRGQSAGVLLATTGSAALAAILGVALVSGLVGGAVMIGIGALMRVAIGVVAALERGRS